MLTSCTNQLSREALGRGNIFSSFTKHASLIGISKAIFVCENDACDSNSGYCK
jgi:hypothetical protein